MQENAGLISDRIFSTIKDRKKEEEDTHFRDRERNLYIMFRK